MFIPFMFIHLSRRCSARQMVRNYKKYYTNDRCLLCWVHMYACSHNLSMCDFRLTRNYHLKKYLMRSFMFTGWRHCMGSSCAKYLCWGGVNCRFPVASIFHMSYCDNVAGRVTGTCFVFSRCHALCRMRSRACVYVC